MPKEPRNKHHHSGKPGQPAQQHHGSTAEETAAVNETFKAFTKDYNEHNEQTGRRESKQFRLETGLAFGVALNIILTGGLLIAGAIQTSDSGLQVQASQNQLRVMDDTEKRQLRAYVGIAPGEIEDFGIAGKQRVRLTRKNYGLTPAYDVGFSTVGTQIIKAAANALINTPPTTVCAQPNARPSIAGLVTIFPTEELKLTISFLEKVSDQEIALVKSEELWFVYFGDVCYRDSFGAVHYTNYCYMYKGMSMASKDADACLQHNDSN